MTIDNDDLTIDGIDLMAQILASQQAATTTPDSSQANGAPPAIDMPSTEADGENTVTDHRPAGQTRWSPPVAAPANETTTPTVAGLHRVQVAIIAGVFALGALLGLFAGFGFGDDGKDDGATSGATSGSPSAGEAVGE